MHRITRRVVAVGAPLLFIAASGLLARAEDRTAEPAPSPLALLRAATARVHRPASAGLTALRGRFAYTTTAFGAAGRRTVGDLIWRQDDGLLVRFGDEAPDRALADGLLQDLGRQLAGTPDFLGVSAEDEVSEAPDGSITVSPTATARLRGLGEPLGWEGLPALRYTLSADGLVDGIVVTGTLGEEARLFGMPDCAEVRCEWTAHGGEALLRAVRLRLLTGAADARREVPLPFSHARTSIEHVALGEAHVPQRIALEIVAGLGARQVTRNDELVLSDLVANPPLTAADLEGYAPAGARPPDPEPLAPGAAAPAWALATGGGERVASAAGEGRVVVLLFWATWCGPCKRAVPAVQKVLERHGDEAVRAFAITCAETDRTGRTTDDDAAAVLREHGGRYPALVAGDEVAEAYGVSAFPTLYVIDRDGRVAWVRVGFGADTEAALGEAVDRALGR